MKVQSTFKTVGLGFAWVYAVLANLAILAYGFEVAPYSGEGFQFAVGWAFSWFQAGGNMIPNVANQQYAEAWGTTKIGDK